ncbi:MAG: hypothetical protein VKP62_13920 [Candidatus Sericytochromatia bacterium]|nr:hypothetical protein [Candidatus Sericytochromatia bacterium]
MVTPQIQQERIAPPTEQTFGRLGAVRQILPNAGRLVGTLSAEAALLQRINVTSVEGATAQAVDGSGKALSEGSSVNARGHFLLYPLQPSRERLFVVVLLKGSGGTLRFRAVCNAPRKVLDIPVLLDAGTTFVADKLRLAQAQEEVALDTLRSTHLQALEDVTNAYMTPDERARVVLETRADFNAFAFDHFMDDHPPLKRLAYESSPTMLRGWEPADIYAPYRPLPTPTPRATPAVNTVGPP